MKTKFFQFTLSCLLAVPLLFSCDSAKSPAEQSKAAMADRDSLSKDFLEQGRAISRSSFEALSSSLMEAMKQGGVGYALQFCNVKANPIADSVSAVYDADIKRISERNRSPFNAPAENEQEIYAHYNAIYEQGMTAGDTVVFADNQAIYYTPIVLAPQCLTCHGEVGEDISLSHHNIISDLYPNDKATGFATGDLRGLWKIGFTFVP